MPFKLEAILSLLFCGAGVNIFKNMRLIGGIGRMRKCDKVKMRREEEAKR
jgi:hypothetical protein